MSKHRVFDGYEEWQKIWGIEPEEEEDVDVLIVEE